MDLEDSDEEGCPYSLAMHSVKNTASEYIEDSDKFIINVLVQHTILSDKLSSSIVPPLTYCIEFLQENIL